MNKKSENETLNTDTTTAAISSIKNSSTGGIGSLIKLLPTGTIFLFQFLNPVVTNSGHCKTSNKYLTSILLLTCGFNCFFSTFTDSYTGSDKKRHYGIVTTKGLWPSPEPTSSVDLSKYRLRAGDFVHAALSLLIFAILGLLDTNTVHCFYPSFESTQQRLLQVLPPVIGVFVGWIFVIFPQHRHGIGYPVTTDDSHESSRISNNTEESPQNPTHNV
ncbi:protein DMP2 [Lathyrus oleraceus]|uniref:Uncharacterized protein n=1 Tax=Pisum sativum TaxID=3888 RepID=A0A9D4X752_PEA|nr:protein DMP2-like [Pisum sativum]KAI5415888.1 hypothetical protein KIW84_041068 [Pisum sativum]